MRRDIITVVLLVVGFIGSVVCSFISFDTEQRGTSIQGDYSIVKIMTGVFVVIFVIGLFSYSKKIKTR